MPDDEFKEYELYYDKELSNPVKEFLQFPKIDAGGVKELPLYIKNKLDVTLNLDISLIGKSITIQHYPKSLKGKESGLILMKCSPKITASPRPIDVQLDIKTEFVM